jgi:hypothetical protein
MKYWIHLINNVIEGFLQLTLNVNTVNQLHITGTENKCSTHKFSAHISSLTWQHPLLCFAYKFMFTFVQHYESQLHD